MPLKRIHQWLEEKKAITCLWLFLISITFFFWLQTGDNFADPDSFYHAKMAVMTAQSGPVKDFPYLQATVLTENFVDHHLLYHLLLIPFVSWLPPLVGIKIAHVFLVSGAILVFFWLLNRLKINGAFWYTLFLFVCSAFVFRLGLVKAQPVSLAIVMIGAYLILARKPFWLLILAWIYVYAYGGWFLLFFLTVLYAVVAGSDLAISRFGGRSFWQKMSAALTGFFAGFWQKTNLKMIFAVSFGHAFGLIFNPYFPQNLKFYWFQLVQIGMINYQGLIGVGAEWYPFQTADFFQHLGLPMAMLMAGAVLLLAYFKKFNLSVKFLFVVAIFFLAATVKSKRYVEYAIPFMVFFAAAAYNGAYRLKRARADLLFCRRRISHYLFSYWPAKIFIITALATALVFVGYNNIVKTKKYLSGGSKFDYLTGASTYLRSVSSVGDIVFHSDWDDFPALFFHNDKNYYLVGLDPTFMYLKSAERYNLWKDVALGNRQDEVYQIVKNDFLAKYVLITTDHKKMNENFENNFYFKKVYSDKEAMVYKTVIRNW